MSDIIERVKSVRVGSIDYRLVRDDELHERFQVAAEIRYFTSEIAFDKDLGEQHARFSLWHEIIHGLLEQGGATKHNEQTINILASGVAQVLRDNPALLMEFLPTDVNATNGLFMLVPVAKEDGE